MNTKNVRGRFSLLLKALYAQQDEGKTLLEFYADLENFRQESVSRISTDKQAIKDVMIIELLELNPNISLNWLFTGEGTMFRSTKTSFDSHIAFLESHIVDLTLLLKESMALVRSEQKESK